MNVTRAVFKRHQQRLAHAATKTTTGIKVLSEHPASMTREAFAAILNEMPRGFARLGNGPVDICSAALSVGAWSVAGLEEGPDI